MRRALRVALLWSLMAVPLAAQQFDFYGRGPYRPAVPRPDSLLGYAVGTRQTMFREQQDVLDRMAAAATDRARWETIGRTVEGRPMRLLIVSSPENLARLDAIRTDLAALADPRRTDEAAARTLAGRLPVVVMLSHSIHGNEPAGFEAAMQTAYQLLASEEPATLEVLRNAIVLINPSQNPDGHERFAAWSNSVAVASDEPAALEQREPWSIQGRFNHYRFDLNRDVLAQSQPETRALVGAVLRWRPQVFVDLHSTTPQYFFPPAAQPINANLPASSIAWLDRFGRGNAAAFDRYGWQYYVRDIFDLLYPGYWDSWPSLNGATGMTYETDGGPELRLRREDGTVSTFEDGIAHHYVATLATLATAAEHRADRLADYYAFRQSALAGEGSRRLRRVVWSAAPDPERARALALLLTRQGIEVGRTSAPYSASKAHRYAGAGAGAGRTGGRREALPAGSYVVELAQPQGRLAAALLEPTPALDSGFVRAQLGRFERNKLRGEDASREGYEFYDVTAWALPLAYGLDAYWTEDGDGPAVTPFDTTAAVEGAGVSGRAGSAYVFPNDREGAARLALHLLAEGFVIGAANRPLRADGVAYPAGTFVVRVQRNPDSLHARIADLARADGVGVTAVASAYADSGQVGVGSEAVVTLWRPRILLAAGDGVSQTGFGDFWHYLERELRYPVVPVPLSAIGRIRLDDYNLLIIPNGSPGTLEGELGESGMGRLKDWVRAGGAIVAVGDVVELLNAEEAGLTSVRTVGSEDSAGDGKGEEADTTGDTAVTAAQPAPPLASPTAGRGRTPEFIPGTIFRATLDRTHWLTFGYAGDELPVPLQTSTLFQPSRKGENPVVFVGDRTAIAGFTWPGNTERLLAGSVWAAVEPVGQGKVVLFAENPLFRGFWRGTARLFTNALLFGPGRP